MIALFFKYLTDSAVNRTANFGSKLRLRTWWDLITNWAQLDLI